MSRNSHIRKCYAIINGRCEHCHQVSMKIYPCPCQCTVYTVVKQGGWRPGLCSNWLGLLRTFCANRGLDWPICFLLVENLLAALSSSSMSHMVCEFLYFPLTSTARDKASEGHLQLYFCLAPSFYISRVNLGSFGGIFLYPAHLRQAIICKWANTLVLLCLFEHIWV